MGGFVACSAKYYKSSQMKGLTSHVKREFEHDENVFPEFSGENFGRRFATFTQLEQRMMDAKNEAGLRSRGFQKSANVMVDNVLILDRNIVNELKHRNPSGYKQELENAATALSERIKNEFGLEPMEINFHWDEGHYEDQDGKTIEKKDFNKLDEQQKSKCEFKNNYHAHMNFLNFDFKELNQPLRSMKRGDFSKFQDFAAESFSHLGFQRGESKKITGNSHLEKKDYLIKLLKKKISELADGFEKEQFNQEIEMMVFGAEKDKANQELSLTKQKIKEGNKELAGIKNEIKDLNFQGQKLMPKLKIAEELVDELERSESRFKQFLDVEPHQRLAYELKVAQRKLRELEQPSKSKISDEIDSFTHKSNEFFKTK
jgi:hypothetical protein